MTFELLYQLFLWLFGLNRDEPACALFGAAARSPRWPAVRARHLAVNPICAACGASEKLAVHHVVPFHLAPHLELDEGNLLTLCEGGGNCHFVWGHLKDWRAHNPDVRHDAACYRRRVENRTYVL